jgi:hypothetical protein
VACEIDSHYRKVDLQAGNGLAKLWLPAIIQIPTAGDDIILSAAAVGPY